jgi:serine/threonine protein kinase
MLGQRLGSYELVEEIGKGGMATVFRAHQPSVNRDVAIKLIRQSIADSPEAVQRFQREARLIARLEHIHILPVYDFDGSHDPPYIVMRLLKGGSRLSATHCRSLRPDEPAAYPLASPTSCPLL